MLLNYLSIAWRSLRKNALYSLINIGGLAAGLCVCMLILLYVAHEHSYDRFHKDTDRLFRVTGSADLGGQTLNFQGISWNGGAMARAADPRITSFTRIEPIYQPPAVQSKTHPGELFSEKNWLFADANIWSFFTFPLLKGDPATALARPFTVVLSERAAKKYFGDRDPIGQVLRYNHDYEMEVTGVAQNPPSNSSIDFDFVASFSSLPKMKEYAGETQNQLMWFGGTNTYLRLDRPGAARGVEKTMDALAKASGVTTGFGAPTFRLDRFTDSHLALNFGDFSNIKYLEIFPIVAGLVLLLALINYMSLATARATTRAKEVGVRKTMGAGRKTVAAQFYVESALYAVLAFVLGWGLFLLLKPGFLRLLHLDIDDTFLTQPANIGLFAGLLLCTIVAAGSYPALVLSSFKPVDTLSGKVSKQQGGALIRKIFTLVQFSVSIALIICSLVMNRQLWFFRHMDTGVDRENVVTVPFSSRLSLHYPAFREEVAGLPGVVRTATTRYVLYTSFNMNSVNKEGTHVPVSLSVIEADSSFIATVGIRWAAPPADSRDWFGQRRLVLNQAAVEELGLPADPLGRTIDMYNEQYTVTGVVRDFNYFDLGGKIKPLAIAMDTVNGPGKANPGCLYVKVAPHTNIPTLMESIQSIHQRYDPGTPFGYQFLDENFDKMFRAEDRLADLIGVFTAITIGIACLGLFGLAAFSAAQRTKEIGIRKVLGAGVYQIVRMLTLEFLLPVGLSILVAAPIAWKLMAHWLDKFAYRISLSPWLFVWAGLGALVIAALTVSSQALRAATGNPVKSLRTE